VSFDAMWSAIEPLGRDRSWGDLDAVRDDGASGGVAVGSHLGSVPGGGADLSGAS